MSTSAWKRVSGAMGIPFVVAYVLLFVLLWNSPDDTSSDAKIVDYYASHSHRVRELTMFFVMAVGLIFFVWFVGHVHGVLRSAEGDGGAAASIAMASGGVFIAVFAVGFSAFGAVSAAISDAGDKFTLDPNTFRLLSVVGFLAYMAAFMLGAPFAFAVGVVAWRTGFLPRWLAATSFLGGIGALLSGLFVPSFLYVAWILLLSGYLAFRPAGATQSTAGRERSGTAPSRTPVSPGT